MKLLRIVRSTLAALATVFVVGCASSPQTLSEGGVPDKAKGILLASITANSDKHTRNAWFFYRRLGAAQLDRMDAMPNSVIEFLTPNDFRDDPSRKGNLVALPLEAGDYELVSWTLYIQTFGGNGYIRPRVEPTPIKFSIQPGRITYLGSMHIETLTGKNLLGFSIPAGGSPEFANKEASDKLLMKRKFPALVDWPFESSVPTSYVWKPIAASGDPSSSATERKLGPAVPVVR